MLNTPSPGSDSFAGGMPPFRSRTWFQVRPPSALAQGRSCSDSASAHQVIVDSAGAVFRIGWLLAGFVALPGMAGRGRRQVEPLGFMDEVCPWSAAAAAPRRVHRLHTDRIGRQVGKFQVVQRLHGRAIFRGLGMASSSGTLISDAAVRRLVIRQGQHVRGEIRAKAAVRCARRRGLRPFRVWAGQPDRPSSARKAGCPVLPLSTAGFGRPTGTRRGRSHASSCYRRGRRPSPGSCSRRRLHSRPEHRGRIRCGDAEWLPRVVRSESTSSATTCSSNT